MNQSYQGPDLPCPPPSRSTCSPSSSQNCIESWEGVEEGMGLGCNVRFSEEKHPKETYTKVLFPKAEFPK
eukprot:5143048-Amphidinium_carterae.1